MKYIIVLIIIIIYILGLIWLIKDARKKYRARSYVYPKTGTVYCVERIIKLKDPSTGEWHKAILYVNHNQEYYAREYNDFCDKFVKLEDWENGKKNKKK